MLLFIISLIISIIALILSITTIVYSNREIVNEFIVDPNDFKDGIFAVENIKNGKAILHDGNFTNITQIETESLIVKSNMQYPAQGYGSIIISEMESIYIQDDWVTIHEGTKDNRLYFNIEDRQKHVFIQDNMVKLTKLGQWKYDVSIISYNQEETVFGVSICEHEPEVASGFGQKVISGSGFIHVTDVDMLHNIWIKKEVGNEVTTTLKGTLNLVWLGY